MSLIYKSLKFVGGAESGTSRIKIGNLIPERPVIRVLLQSHYLHCVVSERDYMRQYIFSKIGKIGNLLLLGGHSYMRLVNQRSCAKSFEFIPPSVLFVGVLNHRGKEFSIFILNATSGINRKPLSRPAVPLHIPFEKSPWINQFFREAQLPVAVSDTKHEIILMPFPSVKISYHIYCGSIRCPFTKTPFTALKVYSVKKVIIESC